MLLIDHGRANDFPPIGGAVAIQFQVVFGLAVASEEENHHGAEQEFGHGDSGGCVLLARSWTSFCRMHDYLACASASAWICWLIHSVGS